MQQSEPELSAAALNAEADQALYQQARQELRSPERARPMGGLFVALFLLFIASQFHELSSVWGLVALLGVILFHEAGHALGMHLFGFRDVRMFFIPFLGAAVSGRPRGAASWKGALVSLLGPLPGILLGLFGLWVMQRHPTPAVIGAVQALVFLNVFNLLPIGFLDGGQFLGRVLFSRHPVLDVGFRGAGAALLVAFALDAELYLLAAFAAFGVFALPQRWRVCRAAVGLRKQFPSLVADPEQLPESEERALFAAARRQLQAPHRDQPGPVARTMESIVDAAQRAPGLLASAGLLLLYAAGLLLGLLSVVQLVEETGPAQWHTVEQPGWRAELPREPQLRVEENDGDGTRLYWRAVIEGTERFGVIAVVGGKELELDSWRDEGCARLARETGATLGAMRRIELRGAPAGECELGSDDRVVRARTLVTKDARYQIVASAPVWGENQRRFFDSFEVIPFPGGG